MPIPPGELEHKVEKLIQDIEGGAASYLLNGKSKTTLVGIAFTLFVVIAQGFGNLYYFIAKAPTTEWVDNRIDEKIKNAPITRGAELRMNEADFRISSVERVAIGLSSDVKDLVKQNMEIKIMLGTLLNARGMGNGGNNK